MLPILCAMDLFGLHAYRRQWSREHLQALLPGALAGIALGALAFGTLPVDVDPACDRHNRHHLRAEPVVRALRTHRRTPRGRTRRAGPRRRHVLGHALGVHEHARPRRRSAVRGVSAAAEARQDAVRRHVGDLLLRRQLREARSLLHSSASSTAATSRPRSLFAPLAPLGIWLGVWLHRRVSERAFYQVSYALLFATGAKLIWDALAH